MLPIEKLSDNVVKIISDSNCYIIENKYIIDTSKSELRADLLNTLNSLLDINKIEKVIFTHLHYDHISCFDLFPNAKFYANKKACESMKNSKVKSDMILREKIATNFNVELIDIETCNKLTEKFEITNTPGHSSSCIVLYYHKDNILFSGDMYFYEGCYGRTDLPTSEPMKMKESVKKTLEIIKKYNPIIAPGHDY